jgi:gamma-glutamyltranspeptidase/glutathione hydrolase
LRAPIVFAGLFSVVFSVLVTAASAESKSVTKPITSAVDSGGGSYIPIFDMDEAFHPQPSRGGMVVSQEQLASQIGSEILLRGGNAIDAAVATGFALAVTLPQAGNLGGGGFMLVYLAAENRTVALDYREMAPQRAYRELFEDANGNVDTNRARFGLQSSGVPGTVAGLAYALEKYGSMSLGEVLKPAIALAKNGIVVSDTLAQSLAWRGEQLRKNPASAAYFFNPDGSPLRVSQDWRQPDLAWSLQQIASYGPQAFYRGAIADKIVATMQAGAGLVSMADLAAYRVVEREPVYGDYRAYRVASMPPPSSGGVHLIQMLNMLENWPMGDLDHNSAAYIHRLTEVMRLAYADRSKYLGDPDFVDVPVSELLDKAYARRLVETIDLQQAGDSSKVRPGLKLEHESSETTHYSVWDREGNVVSNTYTLNFSFGNGVSVAGAGFLLNNEMDDFSAKPGVPNAYGLLGAEANAIEPGKRPLSSMTPTIVFHQGKPVLATGSPGGSTIITVVLQLIVNSVDFGMNIAEATAVPRVHHQWQPDELMLEPLIGNDTRRLLEKMGHHVNSRSRLIGKLQSIQAHDGILFGSSDNRWPGSSVAVAQ